MQNFKKCSSNSVWNGICRMTCTAAFRSLHAPCISTPGTSAINELRHRLFCLKCLKRGDVESNQLPPCTDTLRKHSLRAKYHAAVWRRSLQRCPEIPSPVGCGWCTEHGKLVVDWMAGQPAPQAVLLSCQCSTSSKLPSFSCIVNGLRCTDMCRLQDCTKKPDDDHDAVSVDEDDDEGEDCDR